MDLATMTDAEVREWLLSLPYYQLLRLEELLQEMMPPASSERGMLSVPCEVVWQEDALLGAAHRKMQMPCLLQELEEARKA